MCLQKIDALTNRCFIKCFLCLLSFLKTVEKKFLFFKCLALPVAAKFIKTMFLEALFRNVDHKYIFIAASICFIMKNKCPR